MPPDSKVLAEVADDVLALRRESRNRKPPVVNVSVQPAPVQPVINTPPAAVTIQQAKKIHVGVNRDASGEVQSYDLTFYP